MSIKNYSITSFFINKYNSNFYTWLDLKEPDKPKIGLNLLKGLECRDDTKEKLIIYIDEQK